MTELDTLARSPDWSPPHQRAFKAAVDRCRSERRKLEACDQKAYFVAGRRDNRGVGDAVDLLRWAYATFTTDDFGRGLVASSLASLLERQGEYREAADLYRQAAAQNTHLAAARLRICRALLRANGLRATAEVLALEPSLDSEGPHFIQAYQVWLAVVHACCGAARGELPAAKEWAAAALRVADLPLGRFEAFIRARRGVVSQVDLSATEITHLRRLAAGA